MKPHIVFVEQFFYPDGWGGAQLPRDVTTHLARAGFQVDVVCGSEPYAPVEGDPGPDPAASGVRIRRIPRLFGGDIHRHKLLRQLWFCIALLPLLLWRGRPSLFIVQTNPPLAVPQVAAVAWLLRRPLVIIAMDLYPEVLVAHGALRLHSTSSRMLGALFGWAYRRASAVVSLGPTMSQRLREKGVRAERIATISNWASGDEGLVRGPDNQLADAWGLRGCFVVVYSGNLGIAHDVETPILAVRELRDEIPSLRLLFIGKGSRLAEARAIARHAGVEDIVHFRSLVATDMLPHSLGLADLALVTMRPGFEGLVVPSKLLGYLARGVPTLYIGPEGDVQRLVEDAQAGWCLPNGAVAEVADFLRRVVRDPASLQRMGASAAAFYASQLSRAIGLERYQTLVAGILRGGAGRFRVG